MYYLLIILIGLIFFIVNYKIIISNIFVNDKKIESFTYSSKDSIYDKLDEDVKVELDNLYNLNNNKLLKKHNKKAKKYNLT
jgi:hypothetical protein